MTNLTHTLNAFSEEYRKSFPFSETIPLINLLPQREEYLKQSFTDHAYLKMQESYRINKSNWVEACCSHLWHRICIEAKNKQYEEAIALTGALHGFMTWMLEDSAYLLSYSGAVLPQIRHSYTLALEKVGVLRRVIGLVQRQELTDYLTKISTKIEIAQYLTAPKEVLNLLEGLSVIDRHAFNSHFHLALSVYKYTCSLGELVAENNQFEYLYTILLDNERELFSANSCTREHQDELLRTNVLLSGILILTGKSDGVTLVGYRIVQAKFLRYLGGVSRNFEELFIRYAIHAMNGAFSFTDQLSWINLLAFSPEVLAEEIGKQLQHIPEMAMLPMQPLDLKEGVVTFGEQGFQFVLKDDVYHPLVIPPTRIELIRNLFSLALMQGYDYAKPEEFTAMLRRMREIASAHISHQEADTLLQPEDSDKPCVNIGDNVYVRITNVNSGGLMFEIDDVDFRKETGRIPFVNITPAYTTFNDFSALFHVDDYLFGTVESIDPVVLTIRHDLNYCLMEEVALEKRLTARVTGVKDNHIGWLLETGASCMCLKPQGFTPKKGEYYEVIYKKIDANDNINIQICKPYAQVEPVDCEKEFKEVLRANMVDFVKERFESTTPVEEPKQQPDNNPASTAGDNVIQKEVMDELLLLLEQYINLSDDIKKRYFLYEILSVLTAFTCFRERSDYYAICADYLSCMIAISDQMLTEINKPTVIEKLDSIRTRIEQSGNVYGHLSLHKIKAITSLLTCLQDADEIVQLQQFKNSEDETVSELSRLFMIIKLLSAEETEEKELFIDKAKQLLGCPVASVDKYKSIFFGTEDTKTEFKTSAYESADSAIEEQPLVLAKTLAAFMNTDGGTLYIGVNDLGYAVGMNADLRYARNSVDQLLRDVPKRIFSYLGGASDWNKYMEYIKFSFMRMPANDHRLIMAFRVPAMKDPVYVKGEIYTRSGSRTILKREENLHEFLAGRTAIGKAEVKEPAFPDYLNEENVWCFAPLLASESVATAIKPAITDVVEATETIKISAETIELLALQENQNKAEMVNWLAEVKKNSIPQSLTNIRTSRILHYPMTRVKAHGFTDTHVFLHISENGQIAACKNPKLGKWADAEKTRLICSFDTMRKDYRLLCVFSDGTVAIGTLKSYCEKKNHDKFSKLYDPEQRNLLFVAPVKRDYFLLLVVADESGHKFYRTIDLSGIACGLKVGGNITPLLDSEKFNILYAEVMTPAMVKQFSGQFENALTDNFAIHQGGRFWENGSESIREQVTALKELCAIQEEE